MSKGLIVFIVVIVLCVLCAIGMYVYCVLTPPIVTLDYRYPNTWAFLSDDPNPATEKELEAVIRFCRYQPPEPTSAGYTFAGWYKDIGYTVAWINGEDTVSRNITLYAKWVEN